MTKTQIIALQDTLLKKEPLQSYQLKPNEKREVQKGKGYAVLALVNEGSHSKVTLDYGAGVWYIYNPHWQTSLIWPPNYLGVWACWVRADIHLAIWSGMSKA